MDKLSRFGCVGSGSSLAGSGGGRESESNLKSNHVMSLFFLHNLPNFQIHMLNRSNSKAGNSIYVGAMCVHVAHLHMNVRWDNIIPDATERSTSPRPEQLW